MGLKKYFSEFLKLRNQNTSDKDLKFRKDISNIIGCNIKNINLYKEAFSLKGNSKINYERLEFLGDSILGSIISCYLFNTYQNEDEGFLTQMKSKIVNRNNLNLLGDKLDLIKFTDKKNTQSLSENTSGNLFESFIGAIYLDLNYDLCKKIVLEKLLTPEDILKLENKIISYKGLLLEWSQKKKLHISYETEEEILPNKSLVFRCNVFLDSEKIANASDTSKKKAEEKAAKRAFYTLNKKENIIENSKVFT